MGLLTVTETVAVSVPPRLQEIVELFAPVPPGTLVDATVGGAGHAGELARAHPHGEWVRWAGSDED